MKIKIFLLNFFLISIANLFSQISDSIYVINDTKLISFVYNHITFPKKLKRKLIEGETIISAYKKNDTIFTNFKIIKHTDTSLDYQILEIIKRYKFNYPNIPNNSNVKIIVPIFFIRE